MKKRLTFLVMTTLITLFVVAGPMPGGGVAHTVAARQSLCDELQVVFLIDQSGSMFGTGGAPQASDPNFLRLLGTRRAIETLSTLRYQSYHEATIRAAMLDFGDAPALRMNWTDLNPTTEAEHQQLMEQLDQDQVFKQPDQDRGNTNFVTAFQAASSLFNQTTPQSGGCPARAVIVLTDGQPAGNGITVESHMPELEDYVKQYMAPPDYQTYVVSIDPNNAYWDKVDDYWAAVAGDPAKATRVVDDLEMGSQVIGIAEKLSQLLAGTPPKTQCVSSGPIQIPPFTQQLSFTLVKSVLSEHLDVLDEQGKPVDPARTDIKVQVQGSNDPIETMTVTNPQPGAWTLRTPLSQDALDRCPIRLLSFSATAQLAKPEPNTTLVQFKRVPIELHVTDASGAALPTYADPRYDLSAVANLVSTGVPTLPIALTPQAGNIFTGELLLLSAGQSSLQARGISHNPDQTELVVFDEELATLTVTPVEFLVDQFPSGSLPQYGEIPLSFKLISGGQPVQIDLPLTISVSQAGPNTQPQAITLNEESTGVYTGTIKPEQPGAYTLAYQAAVETPNGPVEIGKGELPFEVYTAHRVMLQIVNPSGDQYVATDLFLRPTGLPLEVQMVDDTGQQLSPGDVGAANPMSLFTVRVLNSDKQDVASDLMMNPTGKPGLFRLADNTIGPGTYEVIVTPAAELSHDYVWAQRSWNKTVNGGFNMGAFVLVAAALALIAGLIVLAIRWRRARAHPLTGYIQIFKLQPLIDSSSEWRLTVMQRSLPSRNHAVITPTSGVLGVIERIFPVSFTPGNPIRRIVLTSPDDNHAKNGQANAQILLKSGRQISQKVGPDLSPIPLEFGYYLEKGPQRGSLSDGITLPDSFETSVERR